jgi:hypothetical protein
MTCSAAAAAAAAAARPAEYSKCYCDAGSVLPVSAVQVTVNVLTAPSVCCTF